MRSPFPTRGDRTLSQARLIAILTPVALLGGAIAFQYAGGLAPCEMCYWQRWPHLAAIFLALGAIAARGRPGFSALLAALAGLAIMTSGAIGAFHAGVEYGWWEGLTRCATSGGSFSLDDIMKAPLVRCDVPAWTLLGISMAGYNAIISLVAGAGLLTLISRWKGGA